MFNRQKVIYQQKAYLTVNVVCILFFCYSIPAAMGYVKFGPITNLTPPNTNLTVNALVFIILAFSQGLYIKNKRLLKMETKGLGYKDGIYSKVIEGSSKTVINLFIIGFIIFIILMIIVFLVFAFDPNRPSLFK